MKVILWQYYDNILSDYASVNLEELGARMTEPPPYNWIYGVVVHNKTNPGGKETRRSNRMNAQDEIFSGIFAPQYDAVYGAQ